MVRISGAGGQPAFTLQGPPIGGMKGPLLVRGVTLLSNRTGAMARDGRTVRLERVAIDKAADTGVVAESGGRIELHESVIAGTHPGVQPFGAGVQVNGDGCTAEVTASRVTGSQGVGVIVVGKAKATLAGTLVDGHRPTVKSGANGWGIVLMKGGKATLSQCRIADTREFGAIARKEGAELTLHATLVDGVRSVTGTVDPPCAGVAAEQGALLTLRGVRVTDVDGTGMSTQEASSVLRGVIFDHIRPYEQDHEGGEGIYAVKGSTLDADSLRVTLARAIGVAVHDKSTATLRRLLVDEVLARLTDGHLGYGATLGKQSVVAWSQSRIHLVRGTGVELHDGAELAAFDLVIDGVQPDTGASGVVLGFGIGATGTSPLRFAGGRIDSVVAVAVGIAPPQPGDLPPQSSDLGFAHVLTGVAIDHVKQVTAADDVKPYRYAVYHESDSVFTVGGSRISSGPLALFSKASVAQVVGSALRGELTAKTFSYDYGAFAIVGATLAMRSTVVESTAAAALFTFQGKLDLSDTVVRGVRLAKAKDPLTSETFEVGDGVVAKSAVALKLQRVLVALNARAGLLVEATENAQMSSAIVTSNQTGVAVQGMKQLAGNLQFVYQNAEQNMMSDQGLAMPPVPPPWC
jgi:hypothetical protein